MASLIVDWVGALATPPYKALILIPQDYDHLTLIPGTGSAPNGAWTLDTLAFWADLKALEAAETGIVFGDLQAHNSSYSVAGTTYADAIQLQCEIAFYNAVPNEDWTVVLEGSNNDIFDVANGIYVPSKGTGHITVVPGNSAGLVVIESLQAADVQAKLDALIAAEALTQEQLEAERTTVKSVAPFSQAGKVVLRNTTVSKRWEADAWEDEDQTIGYRGSGLESVGMFSQVAWS